MIAIEDIGKLPSTRINAAQNFLVLLVVPVLLPDVVPDMCDTRYCRLRCAILDAHP